VFVDRSRRGDAGRAAGEMAARMAAGDAIVLFAEGTTSDGNRVLPFRSALIGAARQALAGGAEAVLVQPVAVAYARRHGIPLGRQG
ncbi:1-acyl-sn-glycerol-3-phosphate acyltransferase, partial [Mycobacterium tuberculosis]|nr:1-acyl-sn-glycerol-3-phosphate acyltransferase [Mycobacterium tuberculosis]